MATIQPAAVRTACAKRLLDAPVALARESEEPYEFIRAPAHSPVHLEFAVGVPRSAPETDRQRVSEGTWTSTEVRVLVPFQIGPHDRVIGVTAALGIEAEIRNALVAIGWTTDFAVLWVAANRSAGPDGWLWLERTFRTLHQMPLA